MSEQVYITQAEAERIIRDGLAKLEAENAELREDRDRWKRCHEVKREEHESALGRIQDALGGHSVTPSQPEADLDIIMRIKAIRAERDALRKENGELRSFVSGISHDACAAYHYQHEATDLLARLAKESAPRRPKNYEPPNEEMRKEGCV